MRYSGGLLGGSWLTALAGDLGAGIFDGAALVQNFENQNPANTLWTKQYNLWSKIDTEPERYLDFEKWWGGHVTLNAEEMQWIVDELFVGNHLAAGDIRTPDGTADRPALDPLADRGLLLQGRQHHPAAAGARLDPRPLRQRRRHPRLGPDHRLHRPRAGRPPRHLRLRRRRAEGARRVRLEHRPDRRPAPRPLRGGADPEGRGGRQPRPRHRRVGDALRGAHPRRHPRPRRQRPRRRAQVRGRRPALGDQPRALPRLRPAGGARHGLAAARRGDAPDAPAAPLLRDVRPAQPVDGLGRDRGRARPRPPAARARPATRSSPRRRALSQQIVEGFDAWRRGVERLSEDTFHAIYGTPALQAALGIDTASPQRPRKARAEQAARGAGRAPHRGARGRP